MGSGLGLESLGDKLVEGSADEAAVNFQETNEVVPWNCGIAGNELGYFGHLGSWVKSYHILIVAGDSVIVKGFFSALWRNLEQ